MSLIIYHFLPSTVIKSILYWCKIKWLDQRMTYTYMRLLYDNETLEV